MTVATADPGPWLANVFDHARALVRGHAAAIIAVAGELLERGELSGVEARTIFNRAWMPPAARRILKRVDIERRPVSRLLTL